MSCFNFFFCLMKSLKVPSFWKDEWCLIFFSFRGYLFEIQDGIKNWTRQLSSHLYRLFIWEMVLDKKPDGTIFILPLCKKIWPENFRQTNIKKFIFESDAYKCKKNIHRNFKVTGKIHLSLCFWLKSSLFYL